MKYWVGVSPMSSKVFVGRINKKWTERLDKEEFLTFDDVISDYFIMKFRETKGDTLELELNAWSKVLIKLVTNSNIVAS